MLHFKFLPNIIERARYEARREVASGNAIGHKRIVPRLDQNPRLTLYSDEPMALRSSALLLDLGLMRGCPSLDRLASGTRTSATISPRDERPIAARAMGHSFQSVS